jgi:hypothetical protein
MANVFKSKVKKIKKELIGLYLSFPIVEKTIPQEYSPN